jgi:hypothetical protein
MDSFGGTVSVTLTLFVLAAGSGRYRPLGQWLRFKLPVSKIPSNSS